MILSDRLEMILSLVPPDLVTADIGTDHGFVPVELVRRGICPAAIAMDVRTGPLLRAKEHIHQAGLEEKIAIRLSDGFAALQKGEADCAVIAGMGGGLMARLLGDGQDVVKDMKYLVLSPHSEIYRVRQLLPELGFFIEDEKMIREDGKFYTGIRAVKWQEAATDAGEKEKDRQASGEVKTGLTKEEDSTVLADAKTGSEREDPDESEERLLKDRFGPVLLDRRDPALKEYLTWQDGIIEGILSGLLHEGDNVALRRFELQEERAYIRKALNRYDPDCPK